MATLEDTTGEITLNDDETFSISLTFEDSLFVIELFGELDPAGAPRLEQLLARVETCPAATVLVDLSGLQFIDSSGIRVLLNASKPEAIGRGRLRLLRAGGQVERTMAVCGVDRTLPFLD